MHSCDKENKAFIFIFSEKSLLTRNSQKCVYFIKSLSRVLKLILIRIGSDVSFLLMFGRRLNNKLKCVSVVMNAILVACELRC